MIQPRKILVILAFCAATSLASAAVLDGLVGAWTFDGSPEDRARGNDGILHGGTGYANGLIGQGIDLDGVDGYVEIPHIAAYDAFADAFSVSAHAFVRAGRDHSAIVWKGSGIGWGPNFNFRLATTSDTNMTWGACSEGVEGWFATDNVYNTGEWVHVALTADGAEVTSYVNGEIMPSGQGNPLAVAAPYLTFPDHPVEIGVGRNVGGADNGVFNYLDGIVDEVALFNRALSQAEVQELATVDLATAVDPKGKLSTTWADMKTLR